MSFNLPSLPYKYTDLEPHIDAKTMEIHHTKHHQGYTNNLNIALENANIKENNIENILKNLDLDNTALRNNAGGFFNHNLYWEIMSPNGGGEPTGELGRLINSNFTSFEQFKAEFSKAASTRFGSGWAWLCVLEKDKLCICSTANQDNPLMPNSKCNGKPILGIDVWEHAYYLNYQNRRPDYINAFFNVISWDKVYKNYLNQI